MRSNWSPLFEKYKLAVAFEHHEHLYKRTFPLVKGSKKEGGVIYAGGGAWGVTELRKPIKSSLFAKTERLRHVYVVTLTDLSAQYEALSDEGVVFDTFTTKGKPTGPATSPS